MSASGTYQINGTELTLQPTTGKWVSRGVEGFTGDGHPEYAGVREFEMRWELISTEDAQQLQNFFDNLGVTGTAVVTLPRYRQGWNFQAYSGCTLGEPTSDEFFEQYETGVVLVVYGIVTQ